MSAGFLHWLGERLGSEPGMIDLVMVAFRSDDAPAVELVCRADLIAHPRVARAVRYRTDTDFYSDP
jgi:hypothetical protein